MGGFSIILIVVFVGVVLLSQATKSAQGKVGTEVQGTPLNKGYNHVDEKETKSEQKESYFTYESESFVPDRGPAEETEVEEPSSMMQVDGIYSAQFDLRQAVVGQVILTNKYVAELN